MIRMQTRFWIYSVFTHESIYLGKIKRIAKESCSRLIIYLERIFVLSYPVRRLTIKDKIVTSRINLDFWNKDFSFFKSLTLTPWQFCTLRPAVKKTEVSTVCIGMRCSKLLPVPLKFITSTAALHMLATLRAWTECDTRRTCVVCGKPNACRFECFLSHFNFRKHAWTRYFAALLCHNGLMIINFREKKHVYTRFLVL